jgi:hypothetical protein
VTVNLTAVHFSARHLRAIYPLPTEMRKQDRQLQQNANLRLQRAIESCSPGHSFLSFHSVFEKDDQCPCRAAIVFFSDKQSIEFQSFIYYWLFCLEFPWYRERDKLADFLSSSPRLQERNHIPESQTTIPNHQLDKP